MRKLLATLLLGGTILTIGPKGAEIGSYYPDTGSFMTTGPQGMKLGTVDPNTGSMFMLDKSGQTMGTIKGVDPIVPTLPSPLIDHLLRELEKP